MTSVAKQNDTTLMPGCSPIPRENWPFCDLRRGLNYLPQFVMIPVKDSQELISVARHER
jgi:hypothetical protein